VPETTDLEALVRARTAELRESRERLSVILNAVPAGILLIDERTHVVCDINPAAAKMIGRPHDEIVGRVCHCFICPAEQGCCPVTDLGKTLHNSERTVLSSQGGGLPILKTVARAMVGGRPHLVESLVDISELKRAEELSRLSGMAEVATGVLHNVGNVLNSVNVTATFIAAKTRELRIDNLVATIQLLQRRSSDLPEFLARDPKGRRVLPYLAKLGNHFQEQRRSMQIELDLLREHIEHIRRIVATQQNYAKASGQPEEIALSALVEDAFRMIQPGFDRHRIRLEREYESLPPVLADKHSVLQILLNLLRNAKDAVTAGNNPERAVRVRIGPHGGDRVRVEVKDSGVGLAAENLTRVFAHGFTTKQNGHGFGLHSGALAARHMGGSLWAESPGLGLGAKFTLELPISGNARMPSGSVS
jgi:PAS domain S-box-containing protein